MDKQNRATILNLSAKMWKETVEDGTRLITFVDSIDLPWLDLINAANSVVSDIHEYLALSDPNRPLGYELV